MFSFLKSAISCPLVKKTHHSKWLLWAVKVAVTAPPGRALGRVCRRKSLPGNGEPCRAQTPARVLQVVWEMGRLSSYHGGQLGDHVAQGVDVALVPGVGPAQVPGHLTQLLGASVVLWGKHSSDSLQPGDCFLSLGLY